MERVIHEYRSNFHILGGAVEPTEHTMSPITVYSRNGYQQSFAKNWVKQRSQKCFKSLKVIWGCSRADVPHPSPMVTWNRNNYLFKRGCKLTWLLVQRPQTCDHKMKIVTCHPKWLTSSRVKNSPQKSNMFLKMRSMTPPNFVLIRRTLSRPWHAFGATPGLNHCNFQQLMCASFHALLCIISPSKMQCRKGIIIIILIKLREKLFFCHFFKVMDCWLDKTRHLKTTCDGIFVFFTFRR